MIPIAYHKTYTRSIYWNMLDSAGSQLLVIVYHLLLRNHLGLHDHGIFSMLISLFYLILMILNSGLDYSLAPFFTFFTQSKKHFGLLFLYYLIPQLLGTALFSALLILFYPQGLVPALKYFIAPAFISEAIRKTAKTFLQIAFKVEITACVEFLGMLACVLLVAYPPLWGVTISLRFVWTIFLTQSLIQAALLSAALFQLYRKLPNTTASHDISTPALHRRFLITRFFAFIQHLSRQLLTGNALVTFAAFTLGLNQASSLKVITSISAWITLIAHKVFGMSSDALMAQTKHMSTAIQQSVFMHMSFYLNQALYALIIFLSINSKKIALMQEPNLYFLSPLLFIMLMLNFIESFFVLYEKWLIIHEKSSLFVVFNLISFGAMYLLTRHTLAHPAIFAIFMGIRLCMLLVITVLTYRKWGLWPSLAIDLRTAISVLILSLLFYCCA